MIESKGPTNTRVYTVAVYFRGKRLAKAEGHSIQLAEMAAAKLALETCGYLVNFFVTQAMVPTGIIQHPMMLTVTNLEGSDFILAHVDYMLKIQVLPCASLDHNLIDLSNTCLVV